MFWRTIPRATDVLARPGDYQPSPSAPSVQRSIAKPPPASAPPADDHDDDAEPTPRRQRRLSLRSLKSAVHAVIADEREKRDDRDTGPAMRHVVKAAVQQSRAATPPMKRRKSFKDLLGLGRRAEDEVDPPRVVPFEQSPPSSPSLDTPPRRDTSSPIATPYAPAPPAPSALPPLPRPPPHFSASRPSPVERRATLSDDVRRTIPPAPPQPYRRETVQAVSARPLNAYEQMVRHSLYLDAPDEEDSDSDGSSELSASSFSSEGAFSPTFAPQSTFPPASPPPRPPVSPYQPFDPVPAPPIPSAPVAGLTNLGNTCYLSCILQCLAATVPFAEFFLSGDYEREINMHNRLGTQGALARVLARLMHDMLNGSGTSCSPDKLRHIIARATSQFDDHEQHDAHDLLLYLLDALHEDLNLVHDPPPPRTLTPAEEAKLERMPEVVAADRMWTLYRERNDSVVVDFFQGQCRNRMECMTCHQTSTTFSPLQTLSLSIPPPRVDGGDITLQDAISEFLKEEILSGESAWNCPNCKRPRTTSKRLSIARLPRFCIIHLKRFIAIDAFGLKDGTPLVVPLDGLDLGHLLPPMVFAPQNRLNSPHEERTTYELYGLCNHYGGDGDGHYKAIVKHGAQWFMADDERVSEISTREVLASSSSVCVLFYRLADAP
ncbi:hypothetical protein JCM10207_008378 [Rhodosporidiobolus poonsookiae]